MKLSAESRRELLDLLLCFVALAAVWLLLGWRPGLQFSRQDGLEYFYSALQVIRDAKQGLNGPAYDPYWLGGSKFAAVWVTPWFTKIFLLLGLRLTDVISLSLALPQLFQAFLSLKLLDTFLLWRKGAACSLWYERFLWAVLFSFTPVFAWRFSAGHLFYPSLLPLACATLLLGLHFRNFGRLGFFITAGIFITCMETQTYPQLIYSFVFGTPLLLFLAWEFRPWKREEILFMAGLTLAAVAWSLRGHIEAISHYAYSDGARQLGGKDLVYSYGLPALRDWINGFFWDGAAVRSASRLNKMAELNYPLGATALLAIFGLRSSLRRFTLLLIGLLVVVALFASDFSPVSEILLALARPLNRIRVPMRALFPLFVFIPPLAAAALDYKIKKISRPAAALVAAWIALLFFVHEPLARELIFLGGLSLAFFSNRYQGVRVALLGMLAFGSVLAFHQRLAPPLDLSLTETRTHALHDEIIALAPELKNPLYRSTLMFRDEKFGPNTGRVLGLSTIEGYWQPTRRFNELIFAAYGLPVMELALAYRIRPEDSESKKIFPLFNVGREIRIGANGKPEVKQLEGGKWISLVNPGNPSLPCDGRRISRAEVKDPYFVVEAEVSGGAPCLLTLATNFTENLHAVSGEKILPVLPVAGSLTGIELPAENSKVTIYASRVAPSWLAFVSLAGLFLLFLVTYYYRGKKIPA